MNCLLAEITWRPAIGDPEPIGWLITLSYLIVGAFCVSAGRHQRAISIRRGCTGYPWFWFGLAAFMFALGVNKQLDLQTLLIQIGRNIAKRGGWYSDRNTVRSVVFFGCAAITLPVLFAWMCVVCQRGRSYILSCLGVLILLAFVGIRALSFNPRVERLMNLPMIGSHLATVMELSGAALVGLAAYLVARQTPRWH
jgi:hypothetical protein